MEEVKVDTKGTPEPDAPVDTGAEGTAPAGAADGAKEPAVLTQEDLTKAAEAAVTAYQKSQEEQARLDKLPEEERRASELASKEKELHEKEMLLTTGDLLAECSLPVGFKGFLAGVDADATAKNIAEFEKAWKSAIEQAVNDRLKGKTPKAGIGEAAVTKEQFDKMNYTQRSKLYNEDKALYDQLKGEE